MDAMNDNGPNPLTIRIHPILNPPHGRDGIGVAGVPFHHVKAFFERVHKK